MGCVDHLTKFAHCLNIHLSNSVKDISVIYVREIVGIHGVLVSIISDRDPRFTLLFGKGMQSILGSALRFSTSFHL